MYIHINLLKNTSNDKEQQAIYTFDDLTSAYASMNNKHGIALKDETTQAAYDVIINDEDGSKMDGRSYVLPTVIDPETGEVITEAYSIAPRVFYERTISGTKEEPNISKYDTELLARGNYLTRLSSCQSNADCSKAIVICLDGKGNYIEFADWIRPE